MYKAVQASRLYEQIVRQIEESIVKGQLKGGDQLPAERQLAEQFGVSRTAVREAVKVLHEKGLVEAYAGRGTFVTNGTAHSIRNTLDRMVRSGPAEDTSHFTEIREIIEPEVAALAAQRGDDDMLSSMREAISVMEASGLDVEAFIEADLDFHLALTEAVGNPVILSLVDSVVVLRRDQRVQVYHAAGGRQRSLYHHKRILEAIEHRDPQGAREAVRAHLRQVREDSRDGPDPNAKVPGK